MGKVAVMPAIRAANEFRKQNTEAVLGPLALLVLGGCVAAVGQWNDVGPITLSGLLIEAVAWTMAACALMRLAFADGHPDDAAFRIGPNGLQWTMQEWRYVGVCILTTLASGGVAVISVIVGRLTGSVAGAPRLLLGLGALIGFLAAVYVGVRLTLSRTATIDQQRITLAWDLTGSAFWPMLGAFLLLLLLLLGVALVVTIPVALIGAMVGVMSAPAAAPHHVAAIQSVGGAVATAFAQIPLIVGLEVHFYRTLRTPAEPAA